jgi:hypothetical protein
MMACLSSLMQPKAVLHKQGFNAPAAVQVSSKCTFRAAQLCKLPARQLLAVRSSSASNASSVSAETAGPLQVVRQAGTAKDVPPEEVVAAMEQLEAAHAKSSLVQGGLDCRAGVLPLIVPAAAVTLPMLWRFNSQNFQSSIGCPSIFGGWQGCSAAWCLCHGPTWVALLMCRLPGSAGRDVAPGVCQPRPAPYQGLAVHPRHR